MSDNPNPRPASRADDSRGPTHRNPNLYESTTAITSLIQALRKLRTRRLIEEQRPVFIPLMAKANRQVHDDEVFSLMDKVQEFLASEQQFVLILGDSGSEKSTFSRHLEHRL
ncbi:hypothetical protein BGZ96_005965 [Linnemannia gamsii]|uniref:Uncharacterized protein n=1 Tax=Linnemannia gamsii TaxID=64522 RepID=A0ABQ7K341_9FUNG|nr:hypothetical protein BGZ96_005965 [Linnemannia gamsii]